MRCVPRFNGINVYFVGINMYLTVTNMYFNGVYPSVKMYDVLHRCEYVLNTSLCI